MDPFHGGVLPDPDSADPLALANDVPDAQDEVWAALLATPESGPSPVPDWGKGVVSTRASGEAMSAGPRLPTGAAAPQRQHDVASGLTLVVCPGLVVVPLPEAGLFEQAVQAISRRQSIPRDKGVVLLPPGSRPSLAPHAARQLALAGIVLARSPVADLDEGALAFANDFLERRRAARGALRRFMSSRAA